jgi:cytoskeletal protein RodZ
MDYSFSESLGPYLKRERESRAVSLEELSKSTRLSRPFLEALEKDDFQFFPQPEFIPGFLKGYARHLGLDGDEILRRYWMQAEIAKRQENFEQLALFPSPIPLDESTPISEPKQAKPLKGEKPSRWKLLLQVAIALVAAGLAFYIHHLLTEPKNSEKNKGMEPHLKDTSRSSLGKDDNNFFSQFPDKIEIAKLAPQGAAEGDIQIERLKKVSPGENIDYDESSKDITAPADFI